MSSRPFCERAVSWEDLPANCQGQYLVFRGMRKAEWQLETSLERTCLSSVGSLAHASTIEAELIREFRRRFHHYSHHSPNRNSMIQWLSLMQHYGAPTRLLDWTYSWQVAAYFAFENMTDEDEFCAIWAINQLWANMEATKLYQVGGPNTNFLNEQLDEDIEPEFEKMVMGHISVRAVFPVSPFLLDERLTIQKGIFLCPGDVKGSFLDNLLALSDLGNEHNVRKLILSRKDRMRALRELDQMNISRATLFPGLDGFAQSLKIYHFCLDPH